VRNLPQSHFQENNAHLREKKEEKKKKERTIKSSNRITKNQIIPSEGDAKFSFLQRKGARSTQENLPANAGNTIRGKKHILLNLRKKRWDAVLEEERHSSLREKQSGLYGKRCSRTGRWRGENEEKGGRRAPLSAQVRKHGRKGRGEKALRMTQKERERPSNIGVPEKEVACSL